MERKDPAEIAREMYDKEGIEVEKPVEPKEPVKGKEEEKPAEPIKEAEDEIELTEEESKLLDHEDTKLSEQDREKKAKAIHKRNERTEKRFSKLVAELKSTQEEKEALKQELLNAVAEMKVEIQSLKVGKTEPKPEDKISVLKKVEQERIQKYIAEDKTLPREERREMPKEDFEEWLIEDYAGATEWMIDQKSRRREERQKDMAVLESEIQKLNIGKEQNLSFVRMIARNPEIEQVKKEREKLIAEGKTEEEIHKTLSENNPKYKVMTELITDKVFMEKIGDAPTAPELLEKEMLNRLKPAKKATPTREEELEARIAELEAMVRSPKRPVGVNIGSRPTGGTNMSDNTKVNPEVEKALLLAAKRGYKITADEYNEAKERRKTIRGAEVYQDEIDG